MKYQYKIKMFLRKHKKLNYNSLIQYILKNTIKTKKYKIKKL